MSAVRDQGSRDAAEAFPLRGRCPSAHTGADEVVSRQAIATDEPHRATDPTSSVTTSPCHLPLKGKAEDGRRETRILRSAQNDGVGAVIGRPSEEEDDSIAQFSILNSQLSISWDDLLDHPFEREPFRATLRAAEAAALLETVYPPRADWFAAFRLTPPERVRVVILGQDPYHEPDQAMGLAFSVRDGVKLPPSLRNIYKELEADLGVPAPASGDLTAWAEQGVLLLNTVLTVAAGRANSHKNFGWQRFTDAVIAAVSRLPQPVAFVLWGAPAQRAYENAVGARSARPSEGSGIKDQGSGDGAGSAFSVQRSEPVGAVIGRPQPAEASVAAYTGALRETLVGTSIACPQAPASQRGSADEQCSPLQHGSRLVLTAPHPSPLSAYRGFFGSRPFSQINAFLEENGEKPIRWIGGQ